MEQPTIRSYRIRGSRITAPQQSALDKFWGSYGIDYSVNPLDPPAIFPDSKEIVLEIGFGMGEATALIGCDFPETGFFAIEMHKPGIGKLMSRIAELELRNIRIIEGDAHPILQTMIPDRSMDGVHLFFPDPWPKKRHNKRRIINPQFLALLHPKIKRSGYFHIATDWLPYAEYIAEVLETSPLFTGGVVERPEWCPVTRFEGQGLTKDHQVTDLRYFPN